MKNLGQYLMRFGLGMPASIVGLLMALTVSAPAMAEKSVSVSSTPVPRPASLARAHLVSDLHSRQHPVLRPRPSSRPAASHASASHTAEAIRSASLASRPADVDQVHSMLINAVAYEQEARTSAPQNRSGKLQTVRHAPVNVERQEETPVASVSTSELKAAEARTIASHGKRGKIWCVPFAREISGINIQGNARNWWNNAAGIYPKGQSPVVGAVLNFRSTRSMPLGHVAVVSKVVSSRKILIDHANWFRNKVSLNMAVVDVSERNDWSRVRVENGANSYGSVYPTYGFIYQAASNG